MGESATVTPDVWRCRAYERSHRRKPKFFGGFFEQAPQIVTDVRIHRAEPHLRAFGDINVAEMRANIGRYRQVSAPSTSRGQYSSGGDHASLHGQRLRSQPGHSHPGRSQPGRSQPGRGQPGRGQSGHSQSHRSANPTETKERMDERWCVLAVS